jgi:guanine deaminase
VQDVIGSFQVGKEFDALLVDACDGATFDLFEGDSAEDAFQKFMTLGDDRNIRAVWVQGGLTLWK